MLRHKELAISLKDNCCMDDRIYSLSVGIAEVTFPYNDAIFASGNYSIPREVWENFQVLEKLFSPENIPPNWSRYLGQVARIRARHGCTHPVDLIAGVFFVIDEHPRCKTLKISQFPALENAFIDLRDVNFVVSTVNQVLEDSQLLAYLTQILTTLAPDMSNNWLNRKHVVDFIQCQYSPQSRRLLDLGCGTGKQTSYWLENNISPIGVDRQYHPTWYSSSWKPNCHKTPRFARADIRHLPFPSQSIDIAIMEYITAHVTIPALTTIITETERVLKNHGSLIVGPQSNTSDHSGWRIIQKVNHQLLPEALN